MKLMILVFLLMLTSCAHTTYTDATTPDGTRVRHVSIAPGTRITTASGACIDATGTVTTCPLPGM